MGKFLSGTVLGVLLSVTYVWYDWKPPEWFEFPDVLQRSLKAAATDDTLHDLDAASDVRQRALEVYFANQAERAAALDANLGHPILRALVRDRVRRRARVLRGLWSAYDTALSKPALREKLEVKHGTQATDQLKRRMLLAALREEPFLMRWIEKRRARPTEINVRELLRSVSRPGYGDRN